MKIPDRWLKYTNSGRIEGTRFVAFKVPLHKEYSTFLHSNSRYRFTPEDLLTAHPDVKLVINLTNTDKYYDGFKEFSSKGILYEKINCPGRVIPSEQLYKKFEQVVDEFLEKYPEDCLIGVHCTHGVNRTGYLIVRYLVEKHNIAPREALMGFFKSRGHSIERKIYIADLLKRGKTIAIGKKSIRMALIITSVVMLCHAYYANSLGFFNVL